VAQERLQRALARAGLGSRRASEELIAAGRVTIGGRVATLGDRVDPAVDEVRVDAHRAATGPHGRQIVAERLDTGDALPVGTQPSDGSLHFFAIDDANERRNCFNLVMPTDRQVRVVDGRHVRWESRIVLRVDRGVEMTQQRSDHLARLALALDDDDETVGQRGPVRMRARTIRHSRKVATCDARHATWAFASEETGHNVPVLRNTPR